MGRSLRSIESALRFARVCAPAACLALAAALAQGQDSAATAGPAPPIATQPDTPASKDSSTKTKDTKAADAKAAGAKPSDTSAPAPVTHSAATHESAVEASPPNKSGPNASAPKQAGTEGNGYGATTPGAATHPEYSMPPVDPAVQPFADLITNNCLKCHNTTDWAGGMALDTMDLAHPGEDPETWEKAINKLRGRLMPPAGQKQPSQPDVDSFVNYLETSVDAAAKTKVGHVPIQRLNRNEFAATVKSLIGVSVEPKQVLPTEIEVEGFNNIAGALAMSPTFMEQYLSAARKVAQRAVGEPLPKMESVFYRGGGGGGGQAGPGFGQYTHRDGLPLGTRGGMSFTHVFPADGEYKFNFLDGDSIDAGLYPHGMETEATLVFRRVGTRARRRAHRDGNLHRALLGREQRPDRRRQDHRHAADSRWRAGRRPVPAAGSFAEPEPRENFRLPAAERSRREAVRGKDHAPSGNSGLPSSSDGCGCESADEVL
jgi:uncharacterized protein DUF1587